MASKKISELTAATNVAANSILVVVDTTGPTTKKITVADFVNSVPSNANFQANVSVLGFLAANGGSFAANVSQDGNNYFSVNNITIAKTATPANTTDVAVAAGGVGQIWTDGSHIYVRANTTNLKRVAIATW
jgi:hypothetical protein